MNAGADTDTLTRTHGEPYCANCGYVLTGATESSKCPECGKPLVEVLMRPGLGVVSGKRFRSKAQILGMPVIDIAIGAMGREKTGRARGFIAIGDVATGVLAIGGRARGLVAIGGLAMGGFTMGGMSLGLFTSLGGMAAGGLAFGGWAIGGLARGGAAMGVVADGGMAAGYIARGGGAFGPHTISPASTSSFAQGVFDATHWFFGGWPPTAASFVNTLLLLLTINLGLAALLAIIGWRAHGREPRPM